MIIIRFIHLIHIIHYQIILRIIILIIRNPFERVISGFLDKYSVNGEHIKLWKHNTITFSKFVDEILINNWEMIDNHHFTQQTTEKFDSKIISKSKELKIYDIKNIDYNYIEKLYNKKIPEKILNFKGGHEKNIKSHTIEYNVFDIEMRLYNNYNIDIKYFYNDIIKIKYLIFIKMILYFLKNMDLIIKYNYRTIYLYFIVKFLKK
jgi:hypothetical protein